MKNLEITLKNGKTYTGLSDGKIYAGKVYLIGTIESAKEDMMIEHDEILMAKVNEVVLEYAILR